jgi:hypothetical protein
MGETGASIEAIKTDINGLGKRIERMEKTISELKTATTTMKVKFGTWGVIIGGVGGGVLNLVLKYIGKSI